MPVQYVYSNTSILNNASVDPENQHLGMVLLHEKDGLMEGMGKI